MKVKNKAKAIKMNRNLHSQKEVVLMSKNRGIKKNSKIVMINGVKVEAILPRSIKLKDFPSIIKTKQNYPHGLLMNLN